MIKENVSRDFLKPYFDSAMESFDFLKVQAIMEEFDWVWIHPSGELKVPSAYILVDTCTRLFDDIYKTVEKHGLSNMSSSTGGLTVKLAQDEEIFYFKIYFTLETSVGKEFEYDQINKN